MVFSSLIFVFSFLPFLLIGNYLWRNRKWQNILLFIGSLYFYAWGEKEKVFVMLATIIVNYFVGILIEKNSLERKRRLYLTVGVIINLGVLVYFKYTKFFIENLNLILDAIGTSQINGIKYEKLPLGISFYTFQSISYLVDVFRKEVKVQKNFLNLGLYITLFPQLVAGPIVRYNDIENQLESRRTNLKDFNEGIRRFIVGLGKKMLIANPIAFVVDQIYAIPVEEINTPLAWVAMIGYALQIYFDFSGYSDMAIGLGRMFGFKILENFNFPYVSKSIQEFWKRWHISLSNWFKSYLYFPLGGNRKGNLKTYRNLGIVFFVTGFWHGASWSFIIWGLSHGFFMIMERLWLGRVLNRIPHFFSNVYMLFIVCFTFILFRVENWENALFIQKSIFGLADTLDNYTVSMFMNRYYWFTFIIGVILCFPIHNWIKIEFKNSTPFKTLEYSVYIMIFILCTISMNTNSYSPFIYFKF